MQGANSCPRRVRGKDTDPVRTDPNPWMTIDGLPPGAAMSLPTFQQALAAGTSVVFDGSTPSALYDRGVFINRSFDEANLQSPDLVRGIHAEFLAAGAQVLTTNTWGANRLKLAAY